MTPAAILALLSAVLQAAPELVDLYQKAVSGVAVSAADVTAILDKYAIDRAAFLASIQSAPS